MRINTGGRRLSEAYMDLGREHLRTAEQLGTAQTRLMAVRKMVDSVRSGELDADVAIDAMGLILDVPSI
jgi:hypothetical protein